MKYEVGGDKMEPIKVCFFQSPKNEKSPAEGREVWDFQAREQRKNDPDNYRGS
ncbi:MAG: hypothetical protein ABJJ25_00665 [Eudoraea sp.]|uniref:hypothetical protein n=1 Tax=Eudoraea sp. TaxID=1979955 RepID=UPI00326606E9